MPYSAASFTFARDPNGQVTGGTLAVADGTPRFITRTGP